MQINLSLESQSYSNLDEQVSSTGGGFLAHMQSALAPVQGQQTLNQSAKTSAHEDTQNVDRAKPQNSGKRKDDQRDAAKLGNSTHDPLAPSSMAALTQSVLPAITEIPTPAVPAQKVGGLCDSSENTALSVSQLDDSQNMAGVLPTSSIGFGVPSNAGLTADVSKELIQPETSPAIEDIARDVVYPQSAAANPGDNSSVDLGESSIQAGLMEDASNLANQAEIIPIELSAPQSAGTVKLPSSANSNSVQHQLGALSAAQEAPSEGNVDLNANASTSKPLNDASLPSAPDSLKAMVNAQLSSEGSQSLTQSAKQKVTSSHLDSSRAIKSRALNLSEDASSHPYTKEKSDSVQPKTQVDARLWDARSESTAEASSSASGADENPVSPAVLPTPASVDAGSRPAFESSKGQLSSDVVHAQMLAENISADSKTLPNTHPVGSVQAARLVQSLSESQLQVGVQAGEFGKINIQTSMTQNQISARIYVEHEDLGKVLASSLPELHEKLEAHRLEAQVELYNTGSDQPGRQQQEQHKPATQNSQINRDTSEPEPRVDTPQQVQSVATTAGLDMHV